MVIPPGLDTGLVLCLAWIGLDLSLLAALGPLGNIESLKERVRVRTYRRLLAVNEYINGILEARWGRNPSEDLVPNLDALREVKRVIDRAAAVDELLSRRITCVELARGAVIVELLLAGVTAIGVQALSDRSPIVLPSIAAFGVGTGVIVLLLLAVASLSARITVGNDF